MATIRELQAKFTATTTGMRSAIRGVVDELRGMQRESSKASKGMSGDFDKQGRSAEKFKVQLYDLEKRQNSQADSVKKARAEYEKMVSTYGETSKQAREAENSLNTQIATQKSLESQLGNTRDAFKEFNREQQLQNSSLNIMGDNFLNIGNKMESVSAKAREIGGSLTKYITLPVAGVITAVGGMTAAFGWKRLVGIDNARAQLKGMGYDTEEVGRISEQVASAIDGGMMTMAEGTSAAAGALASGVEEGEELEKYLKLIDAGAIGMNRSVSETALIFNRVQGSGKLMTQELNMIEETMPGFSEAMAKNAGVTLDVFREMVTAGEVSSEDFLYVMDDFAGGMAEAYADTWSGMLQNTKANIGKLGEFMLEGVFEQSKDSIREFLTLLRSDELREWAKRIGVVIGEWFSRIVSWVKAAIDAFMNLESGTQKLVGWFAAFAVAIGPILVALGTIGGVVASVVKGFGSFFKVAADLGTRFGFLSKVLVDGTTKVGLLSRAFGLLSGPVGWIATGIIALGSAFVVAYNKSETFRNFIDGLKDRFMDGVAGVLEFKDKVVTAFEGIFAIFKGDHTSANELLRSIGLSEDTIDNIFLAVNRIQAAYEALKENVQSNIENIKTFFIERFEQIKSWWNSTGSGIFSGITDRFNQVKDGVSDALSGVFDFFKDTFEDINAWWTSDGALIFSAVQTVFEKTREKGEQAWSVLAKAVEIGIDVITNAIEYFAPIVMGIFDLLWPTIVFLTQTAWEKLKLVIGVAMDLIQGIISGVAALIEGDWSKFGEIMKETALSIKDRVVEFFGNMKDNAVEYVNQLTGGAIDKFIEMKNTIVLVVTTIYNQVTEWFSNMYTRVSTIASNIYTWVRDRFNNLRDTVVSTVSNLYERVSTWFMNLYTRVSTIVSNVRNWVVERFNSLRDAVVNTVGNLYNRVTTWFSNLYNRLSTIVNNVRTRVSEIFGNLRDRVVTTVSNLYERVSSWFTNIYNTIRDKMRDAKDKAVGFATDLYDGAKAQFENLSSAASDMMDKIGEWITNKKDAVVEKATDLGKGIANAAIGGFNKMIGGINDVASLLGYDGSLISEIPTYSTGTNYHPGGAAIVGDKGPGNSIGGGSSTREIIELPNGKRFLADGNVLIPNAPRGMKVKNNRDTEKELSGGSGSNMISRTAKSIGDFAKSTTDKVVTGTKNAVGKVADTADAIWEYAKNPGALISDIIGNIDFNLPNEALELAKLGLGKLKSIATDYIKGLFDNADGGGDGSYILGKQIYQRFGGYTGGIGFNGGNHYGVDTAHKFESLLSPINGVVSRIWNDYGGGNSIQVDAGKYTWWFMHLSKILTSVGERISAGQKIAVTGNSGNFVKGDGHLHTQVMQGGVGNAYAIDPIPILENLKGAGSAVTGIASKIGGYFRGGITSGFPELAWLNEEGFRESIISHNPAHRERSESIWQTTGDKLGFGKNDEELRLMREENALLKQIVINTGDTADNTEEIKHKNPKIVIDEYEKKRDKRKDDTTIIV